MKYRKKPVEIEARQFIEPGAHDVYLWAEEHVGSFDVNDPSAGLPPAGVSINAMTGNMVIMTLEGLMTVQPGDWVIKGIEGEFYPCKDRIFQASYDAVGDE